MAYRSNGFGNAWDQTEPGTIRSRTDKKGREYFERAVRMRSHAPAKSGAPAYGISWERYSFPTQQAAPAPAAAPPPKPAPAPAPAPVKTPKNPYKKQADDLLKTIDKILAKPADPPPPPPKPVTIFGGSTALSGGDLQIAPANKATKNTGTGGFKRRKSSAKQTNAGLRTVQSLNV